MGPRCQRPTPPSPPASPVSRSRPPRSVRTASTTSAPLLSRPTNGRGVQGGCPAPLPHPVKPRGERGVTGSISRPRLRVHAGQSCRSEREPLAVGLVAPAVLVGCAYHELARGVRLLGIASRRVRGQVVPGSGDLDAVLAIAPRRVLRQRTAVSAHKDPV